MDAASPETGFGAKELSKAKAAPAETQAVRMAKTGNRKVDRVIFFGPIMAVQTGMCE